MTDREAASEFFRCTVSPERRMGKITVKRSRFSIQVHEASIDGFTVSVNPPDASKLRLGRPWKLHYEGAVLEVHPQWLFSAPDGTVQIGLRRLRDLTRLPTVGWSWGGNRMSSTGDGSPSLLLGGLISAIIAVVVLVVLDKRPGRFDPIATVLYWFS